jgi:segregation and condensation protein B
MEQTFELKPKIEALLYVADRPVTIKALARCLETSEEEVEAALLEYESELLSWDRGIQVRHRPQGVRIETKAPYTELIGKLFPERRAKPLTSQALETLAIIALKQPVSTADITAIRGVENAGTVQTLRDRKLIARAARLGPQREMFWHTTQLFLETYNLVSIEQLREEGQLEKLLASVDGTTAEELSEEEFDVPVEAEPEANDLV